jgi:hypothetical protein
MLELDAPHAEQNLFSISVLFPQLVQNIVIIFLHPKYAG